MDDREKPPFPEDIEAASLAEPVRPEMVSEFVGQAHIMGPGGRSFARRSRAVICFRWCYGGRPEPGRRRWPA